MKLTPIQKATAQAIVNVFETGSVQGDYSSVILIPGDRGRLTVGRSQTTIASGNLYLLGVDYCNAPGARYADGLRPYLPALKRKDVACDTDMVLRKLLRDAGKNDPIMRSVQDAFFDRVYWDPAVANAERLGIQTPMGMAVVYDSTVHGSFQRMADRTTAKIGSPRQATEKRWIGQYISTRRAWLKSCAMPLPNTVYRMDVFYRLILGEEWDLEIPLVVRGCKISLETMGIATSEDDAWTLYLNDVALGKTWQNPQDAFRNYFPARTLLSKLHGEAETEAALHFTGTDLEWNNKPMNVPALLVAGDAWGQVRALAGASGLVVERDIATRTLRLSRNQEDK